MGTPEAVSPRWCGEKGTLERAEELWGLQEPSPAPLSPPRLGVPRAAGAHLTVVWGADVFESSPFRAFTAVFAWQRWDEEREAVPWTRRGKEAVRRNAEA